MNTQPRYPSYHISKYDMEICNELFDCRVYWARVISSETESLFTQYTKHTFYEIQYALEGRIGMLIGENQLVDFDESDFIIIPPDTYHQIVDADTQGARFIMAFTLNIKKNELRGTLDPSTLLLPHGETAYMRELLSLLLKKNYRNTLLRKQQITSLLESFLMEILEVLARQATETGKEDGTPESEAEERVARILACVRDYHGIGIRVSELARQFNLSERHLNRLFLNVTGQSPKEAINHEKMKRVESLVATTSLTLSEISELCGFCDEYAMNKFFRRYNRVGLSEFRRLAKKEKKQ